MIIAQSCRPWTRQPQIAVATDPRFNVRSFFIPSHYRGGAGCSFKPGSHGLGLLVSSGSSGPSLSADALIPASSVASLPTTTQFVVFNNAVSGNTTLSQTNGTANNGLLFRLNSGTTPAIVNSGIATLLTSSKTVPLGTTGMAAFRYGGTGNAADIWVNGQKTASGTLSTTFLGGNPGIGCAGNNSGAMYSGGGIYLHICFGKYLSDAELLQVFENPWQIFQPEEEFVFFGDGAPGGATSVYADSALIYSIRSMLSSDSGIAYAIRNAIYQDDDVGYYLRASIAQNNEVGYVLREAIAQNNAAAYNLRGLIQTDDIEAYNVRGLVQTSGNETYSIRGAVQTDVTTNYDIQSSTSVASTNTVSYSVRGSVSGDVSPSYAVRAAAQSDVSAGYSVRASAYRDVAASYAIEAASSLVYADLTASYSIDGVAPSVDYGQIAAAVVAAMQTSPTPFPSNVTHFNGNPTQGSGQPNDPVRPL